MNTTATANAMEQAPLDRVIREGLDMTEGEARDRRIQDFHEKCSTNARRLTKIAEAQMHGDKPVSGIFHRTHRELCKAVGISGIRMEREIVSQAQRIVTDAFSCWVRGVITMEGCEGDKKSKRNRDGTTTS